MAQPHPSGGRGESAVRWCVESGNGPLGPQIHPPSRSQSITDGTAACFSHAPDGLPEWDYQGSHGPAVRKLHRLLNDHLPDLKLVVDGQFGPVTDGRVREFQQRVDIAVDGIVGPQT
ncbi:peptidoglycan-binding domain-containing protein [Streptomyces sp. NPDC003674]|uniref:peptidoglycan-binding domain-containing protein n=1 Tax=unclassified Streptomyces TaxID=2593676 RepID=UPI0036848C15